MSICSLSVQVKPILQSDFFAGPRRNEATLAIAFRETVVRLVRSTSGDFGPWAEERRFMPTRKSPATRRRASGKAAAARPRNETSAAEPVLDAAMIPFDKLPLSDTCWSLLTGPDELASARHDRFPAWGI